MFSIESKKKIYIFARIVLLAFLIGIIRIFWIQFVSSSALQEEVIKNRVKEIEQIAERGRITDRNGNILSMSLMTQDIAIYPNLIENENHQKRVAEVLSKNIKGVEYEEVLEKAKKTNQWERIARRVDPDITKKIKDENVGGIEFKQSPKRFYPNGSLGGTFLGFVNQVNDPGAGLEISLNEYLAGIPGYTLAETTPMGNIIPVGFQNVVSPINGQNVQTTIDSYIQHILEDRLKTAVEELEPVSIHATIMEPKTGNIVAMASYPSFDPNHYEEFEPETWTNSPVNFTWEPGSIFKPLFMAAALNYGTIDGTEIYPSGRMEVHGVTLRDWNNGKGFGMLDLEGIIVNSSNVGMINIANTLSNEQIVEWLDKIGFNKTTGIQLPGEQIGYNFPTVESLNRDPIRKATISFGQGISVSPIRMITSFSELINGGYKLNPSIVQEITDNFGNVLYKNNPTPKEVLYKPEVVEFSKQLLKENYFSGSGVTAQVEGYDGGGKTGTAWVVEDGKYKEGAIIGSYIGFMPYENPKYTILVIVQEPNGVEFGSEAANPIVKDVMTEILRYEGVRKNVLKEGEERIEPKHIEIPNVSWLIYEDAIKKIKRETDENVEFYKVGNGEVVIEQTYTYSNNQLNVFLHTKEIIEEEHYFIPILIGKSKEEVLEIFKNSELDITFRGTGRVKEQNIQEGRHFKINNFQIWLN